MMTRWNRSLLSALVLIPMLGALARAQWKPLNPVESAERQPNGVLFKMKKGALRLVVLNNSMIRVLYAPETTFSNRPDYVVIKHSWPRTAWSYKANDKTVTLTTPALRITVTRSDGDIVFSTADGKRLMDDASRRLWAARANGEATYHAEERIAMYGSHQGLFGLGQHQAGVWNYRGESVDLQQQNTEIAVPLMLSSKGYGLFWNNDSVTKFDNRFPMTLYIHSQVADQIDYTFLYGPSFDRMIAEYRELTGEVPMYGKWAYGFWQCKNRYNSQAELLGIAAKYRELHIPVDNIVQDWFWWTMMGSFIFNSHYPHPKQMVEDLHREHFHLMISIWPFFYPGSSVYDTMEKRGFFIAKTVTKGFHPKGMALYDATNPQARAYYWSLVNHSLFRIGVDAWWMDTDEPESQGQDDIILRSHHLYIGDGARYANIYPLFHTMGVYQGQRSVSSRKRVFILSRSAYAGAQRYGVTAWSGDTISDWLTFRRQIPAGLNYSVSGMPYWTTDIGGFFIGNPDNPAYRQLFVRWFEYGAFCPIFRVHGTRTTNTNELWSYGRKAEAILTQFDRLRYRLLPYIYSLAWMTTHNAYTMMRPLVMDFPGDPDAMNVGNQFMFGPAIMVNPVTHRDATTRTVYLPKTRWYDFWSGETLAGGRRIQAAAPLDRIPLFVRAGSIMPMGPDIQYSTQKPENPIELRVYPGADGKFTLYEDQNDNYNYEKGVYATIPFRWNEATQTLTIGARQGSFPGMLKTRTFDIVFVRANHGAGIAPTSHPDRTVVYSGSEITIKK